MQPLRALEKAALQRNALLRSGKEGTMKYSRGSRRWLSVGALGACLALGCASRPSSPPPALPPPGPDGTYTQTMPQPPQPVERRIGLELGADLKRCQLTEPHFFFDEARLRPQDAVQLEQLAQCLNREPLRDVNVVLVGRADPRGADDYNQALGSARAERVKGWLVEHGVDASRISTRSQGEADAIGDTPDAAYGYDRRVDVVQLAVITP
jgi:outer membrane protein OmpA-like peptidoglycan-associated protein